MKLEIYDLRKPSSGPAWSGEVTAVPREGDHVTVYDESGEEATSGLVSKVLWGFGSDGTIDAQLRIK